MHLLAGLSLLIYTMCLSSLCAMTITDAVGSRNWLNWNRTTQLSRLNVFVWDIRNLFIPFNSWLQKLQENGERYYKVVQAWQSIQLSRTSTHKAYKELYCYTEIQSYIPNAISDIQLQQLLLQMRNYSKRERMAPSPSYKRTLTKSLILPRTSSYALIPKIWTAISLQLITPEHL